MNSSGSTSGRTVAARFSSPDLQSSNSSWQCRVEASACSNLTSTVELLIRNAELESSSFFSSKDIEGLGRVTLPREIESVTPFSVDLHLVNGSRVQPAYMLVTADINITMICGIRSATPSTTFCNQCASSPCQEGFECVNLPGNFSCVDVDECGSDPSPCDVPARCNNTEGSFHCYCNPGFVLSDSGTACMGASTPEPLHQTSVVGLAVGGAVAAVVVIVLIVIIACFCCKRSQKKQDEDVSLHTREANPHQGCPNNAYDEVRLSQLNSQHRDNVGTANDVTSESDSTYDVLFKKRPTADKKRDVIYGHLDVKGSPHDNVEDKDTCAGNAKGPGATPDPVNFTVEPESPAARAKQDDKAAVPQNGGGE